MNSKQFILVVSIMTWTLIMTFTLNGCNSEKVVSSCIRCPTETTKYGLIRDACGPADAPITEVTITDSATTCQSERVYPYTSAQLEFNGTAYIPIRKGNFFNNHPAWHCEDANSCSDAGKLSYRILDTTYTHVYGEYWIERNGKVMEMGRTELVKCFQETFCP